MSEGLRFGLLLVAACAIGGVAVNPLADRYGIPAGVAFMAAVSIGLTLAFFGLPA